MAKVIIRRWDGGVAQSERPETINEHLNNNDTFPGSNGGFNVFADPFKLTKLTSPSVNETASGASVTSGECPVFDAAKRGTDGLIIGYGSTSFSGSGVARFYRKDTSITGNWVQNSASGLGVELPNGAYCVLYKDLFFGISSNAASTNARLYRYDTDSTQTLIDTVSDYAAGALPKPVVHSQDKKLYYASNKTVRVYDGSSAAAGITTDFPIISLCEYGAYLAIACQTPTGGIVYLWGRDTALTTFQDVIKVDNGKLQVLENVDGYLVAVTQTPYSPFSAFTAIPVVYSYAGTVNVRMYLGGVMKLIKKATLGNNEQNSTQKLLTLKFVKDNKLFFSTNSNFLWAFGANRNGEYILARDQQIAYTNRIMDTLHGMFALGEYVFGLQLTTTGSPSNGLLQRTDATFGSDSSYYTTTINPAMPIEDRAKLKKLKSVYLKGTSLTTSGTVNLKYSYDANGYTQDVINESITSVRPKFFETSAQLDSEQFAETRDLTFQIGVTGQIDITELGYEYDTIDTISD